MLALIDLAAIGVIVASFSVMAYKIRSEFKIKVET
jgi:hypothetical protein